MSYGACARGTGGGLPPPAGPWPRPACAHETPLPAVIATTAHADSRRTVGEGFLVSVDGSIERAVNRLDELVRCPCRVLAESPVVVAAGTRGLDLVQRHPLLGQRRHAVAHDGDHVAVVGNVGRVGHAAVSGDDERAAL